MTLKRETVDAALEEMARMRKRIEAYRECQKPKKDEQGRLRTKHDEHGCPCSAAVRRASMDVTRAMTELRR